MKSLRSRTRGYLQSRNRDRSRDQTRGQQREKGGLGKLGGWDGHVYISKREAGS